MEAQGNWNAGVDAALLLRCALRKFLAVLALEGGLPGCHAERDQILDNASGVRRRFTELGPQLLERRK